MFSFSSKEVIDSIPQEVPFNKPYMTGNELAKIAAAHSNGRLAGDGPFTEQCSAWLCAHLNSKAALLTHSCTAALEMAALLMDIGDGDEVIMPSYTFVSTANAFVLRGAVPVFVDIRADTLNIDEKLLEAAITERTRAVVPVHYAGVGCEMDAICSIAAKHGLSVVEDAAQGIMSKYKGRNLGTIGDLGTLSFHETKNVISGEGGALLINRQEKIQDAEIIREKGTDRSRFERGFVDKYTWRSVGSSYLPGEITAAFLSAQLEQAYEITSRRREIWAMYNTLLTPLASQGLITLPHIPSTCEHNAHMYYFLLSADFCRSTVLAYLKSQGVNAVFHYVPLHDSPAGQQFGRCATTMATTTRISAALLRLPLWIGMTEQHVHKVVEAVKRALCS